MRQTLPKSFPRFGCFIIIGLFLVGIRFRFKVCTPDFQLNDKVFCTREQSLYCFCTKTDLFFQVLGPIKLCGSYRLLSCASLHFLTHSATLFERGAPSEEYENYKWLEYILKSSTATLSRLALTLGKAQSSS